MLSVSKNVEFCSTFFKSVRPYRAAPSVGGTPDLAVTLKFLEEPAGFRALECGPG